MRYLKVAIATVLFTIIVPAAVAQTAQAALPTPMQPVFAATGTTASSVNCVSAVEMRQLTGAGKSRFAVFGLADPLTREIWFDQRGVCQPILDYLRTGRLTNWTVDALGTVGHEASHLRSVSNERKAECLGARFSYRWLDRHGAFNTYTREGVRRTLLDDSHRPAEYKLGGTCQL